MTKDLAPSIVGPIVRPAELTLSKEIEAGTPVV
jgi:hypothetical protein